MSWGLWALAIGAALVARRAHTAVGGDGTEFRRRYARAGLWILSAGVPTMMAVEAGVVGEWAFAVPLALCVFLAHAQGADGKAG